MTSERKAGFSVSKRRFIVLAGSAAAVAAMGTINAMVAEAAMPITWNGSALGARATIQLYHSDPAWAERQLQACQREIDRLENLFSLYRPNSAVRRLNADGYLNYPDMDFLTLMSKAVAFSDQTEGVFDISVQPLWQLYARHFAQTSADPKGPNQKQIDKVLTSVGSGNIDISSQRIAFNKTGMGVTLNGIAQGFITDRITALLKRAGFEDVLVSLGENYGLGARPDKTPWKAGILSPADGKTIARTINLQNRALATSGGYGSPFTATSNINHLIHPLTGKCAVLQQSVSVIAASAVKADMASTALSLMSEEAGAGLVSADLEIADVIRL